MAGTRTLLLAAAAAAAGTLVASRAEAAPVGYQTAVLADNPYVYYRLNESPVSSGTAAADTGAGGHTGTYFSGAGGSATGGVAGAGTGSDNAVAFPGTGTGATGAYLGAANTAAATNIRGFGSFVGASSYEVVFKVNAGFSTTTKQSLFGVFNTGSTTAAEITLNSQGNDALGAFANTTRLFIRGDDADAVGVHFVNPTLYDGNYHDLLYTFDASQSGVAAFAAYVDGVPQTLALQQVGTGAADADTDPDNFVNFGFDPTFAARNVRGALGATAVAQLANVTIDEAALYSSVLTAQQAATHAAASGVPEPGSLALLSIGVVAFVRRRRAS
jgi:hypothetical protein